MPAASDQLRQGLLTGDKTRAWRYRVGVRCGLLTVDGSEIPYNHRLDEKNPGKYWDKLPFPQLVPAGFLNHQQYDVYMISLSTREIWSISSKQIQVAGQNCNSLQISFL